jgi:hypothetical protein
MSWRTEYYEYLDSWSAGFRSLRVWINPRASDDESLNQQSPNNTEINKYGVFDVLSDDDDDNEDNYMPITF